MFVLNFKEKGRLVRQGFSMEYSGVCQENMPAIYFHSE
jgi:hypothetical protein